MAGLLATIFFIAGIVFGFAGLWEPNKKKLLVGAVFLWLSLSIVHFFIVPLGEVLNARS